MTLVERFNFGVDKQSGCWLWKGTITEHGYGTLVYRGKRSYAHRFSYEINKGPIPNGLEIDHICRNRSCVNPEHLEAVTHRTNVLRGTGASAQHARRTRCPKGHKYTRTKGGRRCRVCINDRRRKVERGTDGVRLICVNGHPMTESNRYYFKSDSGRARCRACHMIKTQRQAAAKRCVAEE